MKQTKALILILLLLIIYGCVGIKPLSYFQVDPFSKPFGKKTDMPIDLVLMDDVKDSLVVRGNSSENMVVTEFRNSFGESMKNALKTNFETIHISDEISDSGLSLVIYRVKPFWKLNSQSTYDTNDGEKVETTNFNSAAFQFESSLFLNGNKLESADLTVYSEGQMSAVQEAHSVFKSGLTQTCETILREIFKDRVVQEIMESK